MLPNRNHAEEAADNRAARAGAFCCAAMIASQVAGKATRDALFLSNFAISSLPIMLIAAAALSIVVVLAASRLQAARRPARFTSRLFAWSAVLLLGEYAVALVRPRPAAVLVYLHTASLGALLISSFWSVVNERFDPRSAKRRVARIGAGGTLGGLAGGLAAERVGASFSVPTMLPALALLNLVCFLQVRSIGTGGGGLDEGRTERTESHEEDAGSPEHGPALLRGRPFLRNIALLVLAGTVAAALLDYVFKAEAAKAFPDGPGLMRFFAVFYTVVSLVTFLLQSGAGRRVLETFGLARAVGSLPLAVVGGGIAILLSPGLLPVTIARGLESVFRSSLFRSGYELLYTPIRPVEKRAAKPVIDVGVDRFGDMLGGAIVRAVLFLPAAAVGAVLIGLAILLSLVALFVVRSLHRGYVRALERSLVSRAIDLNLDDVEDRTTRSTMIQTISSINLSIGEIGLPSKQEADGREEEKAEPDREEERIEGELAALRSGDPERVREVLRGKEPLDSRLVTDLIRLLAWDEVTGDAARALSRMGPGVMGKLIERLLDQEEEFTIRRRLPRVLASCPTKRCAEGLMQGLWDRRFEVRFQCGRALARMHRRHPEIPLQREEILFTVLREVGVDRKVWESERLLDKPADDEESLFVDEVLRERANRSLEHVFTLLALVLPKEPLQIAFKGLHTEDRNLRGTALEYLESILPEEIRRSLWPFLEAGPSETQDHRPRDEVLADLLRSNKSIQISLQELRKKRGK